MTTTFFRIKAIARRRNDLLPVRNWLVNNVPREKLHSLIGDGSISLFQDDDGVWIVNIDAYFRRSENLNSFRDSVRQALQNLEKTNIDSLLIIRVLDCTHDDEQPNTPCVPEVVFEWP